MSAAPVTDADAIVVGAGLSGSWVAKELTAGGMTVALLDAGPILSEARIAGQPQSADLFNPRHQLFRLKLLLKGDRQRAFSRFVHSGTADLYLDRSKDPYATATGRDFSWTRVRAVGGRGHLWGRVMLRLTNRELTRPGFEWPVRYEELAPFYSDVERLLDLGGAPSGLPGVPDGAFVHQRTLHPLEAQFCAGVARRWPDRQAAVNHVAAYEPAPLSPMLAAAQATGRLRLAPNTVVAALATDGPANAVTGVVTVTAATKAIETLRAPIVILAASAFETVRILLNSRSDKHRTGVGNGHGLVGTRILEHMMTSLMRELPASARSAKPKYGHNPFKLNAEPHGFYLPPFGSSEATVGGYSAGYGVQGTLSADTGLVFLGAFGETEPMERNRLRLNAAQLDGNGIPSATIDFSWSNADLALYKEQSRTLAEMMQAFAEDSGIELVNPVAGKAYDLLIGDRPPVPGSNHESGGARMGTDPAASVVDPYNRVWDAPNVLVCDSACFPSLPHQNPTLTTMALAVRAARKLLATV